MTLLIGGSTLNRTPAHAAGRARLVDRAGHETEAAHDGRDPVAAAAALVCQGAILAVKGLGGYHLACDPFNDEAVDALRSRKVRQDKPFALMARDLEQVRALCHVSAEEAALLAAPSRPIVLLERGDTREVAAGVAPRQRTLGVMLAYTPLHHLLLNDAGIPLLMTSGNRSDEPIAYRDEEAFEQLNHIADFFLVHDRPIHIRCDDSVARTALGEVYPVRRSRGYAPAPLQLAHRFSSHTLACGGELKNTFCLGKDDHALLSHHIGDLDNYQTFRSFSEGVGHFCRLFDVQPELVAYDLHPEYLSTKYAHDLEEQGLAAIGVQHHHAHVASCLVDNGRPATERVVGVALDGTGYGTDGAIWGGELFEGSVQDGFVRRAHLAYVPLPGGAAAIRQPWRMALAHLFELWTEEEILALSLEVFRDVGEEKVRAVGQMIRSGLNAPPTSSAGRLFDAVAALLRLPGSLLTTYEGQAAVELELSADGTATRPYRFQLRQEPEGWVVEVGEVMAGVVADVLKGRPAGEVAACFHRTVAEIVVAGCRAIREGAGRGISAVALSGGAFQNLLLLQQMVALLKESGFGVYVHRRVPTNDGGLSLGQAVLADMVAARGGGCVAGSG